MSAETVLSQGGATTGHFTGGERRCSHDCRGFRKAVRWQNGRLTYVCTTDLTETRPGHYQLTPRDT